MDLWLYWICLGIVLFAVEMFVMTFDLLALGIASLITGVLTYFLGIELVNRQQSGVIFLIASLIAIMITRLLVAPKIKGSSDNSGPMSAESMIGKKLTVQEINKRDVIRYEGVYRNVKSDDDLVTGDSVIVEKIEDNSVYVKKA